MRSATADGIAQEHPVRTVCFLAGCGEPRAAQRSLLGPLPVMGQLLAAASSLLHRWVPNGSAPRWSSSWGGFEAMERKGTWMEEQPSIPAPNLLRKDSPAGPVEGNGAHEIRAVSLCLCQSGKIHAPGGIFLMPQCSYLSGCLQSG